VFWRRDRDRINLLVAFEVGMDLVETQRYQVRDRHFVSGIGLVGNDETARLR
jgi:hypothetical protein